MGQKCESGKARGRRCLDAILDIGLIQTAWFKSETILALVLGFIVDRRLLRLLHRTPLTLPGVAHDD